MLNFCINTNIQKDPDLSVTRRVAEILEKKRQNFYYEANVADYFHQKPVDDFSKIDVLLVIGGDGTILKAARTYAKYNPKILAINLGRLGFLTETELSDLDVAIDHILCGAYKIDSRVMLKASIVDEESKRVVKQAVALNDCVVSQRKILRMINVEFYVDQDLVESLYCDGIVVSSPTGSTGYSLSAGGPILTPNLECFVITPVCAHTLQSRSMVIASDKKVLVRPRPDSKGVALSIDGQEHFEVEEGQAVIVEKSDHLANFIRLEDRNFFGLLKQKLTEWNMQVK